MATAETKSRRPEDDSVRNEELLSSEHESTQRSKSKSNRSTRQLDFFQAMADFHEMFPTMEDDVIEAVLRANDGAVDATIDQLLTMSIDSADATDSIELATRTAMLQAFCPEYKEQDASVKTTSKDSPPSYSEAMRSNTESSIWTTPIQPSPATTKISATGTSPSRNLLDLDVDELSLSNTDLKSPQGAPANTGQGFSFPRNDSVTGSGVFSTGIISGNNNSANTQPKRAYRNWNPPMLGTLPDDFLRIMPLDSPTWVANSEASEKNKIAGLSTSPINVLSLSDTKPKVHKSRSKSEKVSRSFSATSKDIREKDPKSRHSDKLSKSSEKMMKSLSLAGERTMPERSHSHRDKVSRSYTCGGQSRHRDINSSRSPTHRSMVLATHDFSAGMLEERMKENERRRKRTSIADDPELIQYLEDEKLAIALQNSEFLQELRGNEDFMKTLERDRMNASAFDQLPQSPKSSPPRPPSPKPTPVPLPSTAMVGYGEDNQSTLEPFPFSQPVAAEKDDDIELRRQLKQMGKASKTKFAALAKKFFKRKKKTHKLILNEKLAPSMMNLLDNDDDDNIDDGPVDPRYDRSPEIEPLPSSLIGVPSHRTVQRPAYTPDGVTTYYDNKNTDIV